MLTPTQRNVDLSYRDSVKVNLETMTRCGGSCMGCMLEASERKSGSIWPRERFDRITPFVAGFLRHHLARFDPVEVSINCGQGDHLLADPEDLTRLVDWIDRVGQGRAIGFMTASAVGKHDRVRRAVDAIRQASLNRNQPIMLDVVFDPVKTRLSAFAETYARNLAYVREAFGGVDLAINLGPDTVSALPPSALHSFLTQAGIRRFTVNLTPTLATGHLFSGALPHIFRWSRQMLSLWSESGGYEINLAQVAGTALLLGRGLEAAEPLRTHEMVRQSASRSVYIDDTDRIWHSQEGFGDVAFSRRIGWRSHEDLPVTSSDAGPAVERSSERFALEVTRRFVSSARCGRCVHSRICPRIGGAHLMAVGAGDDDCPSGLLPLLDEIADRADLEEISALKTHTYLPIGFTPGSRPHARVLHPEPPELDFSKLETAS